MSPAADHSAGQKPPRRSIPPAAAGVKRPAPSLLPPFEPSSSSSLLSRPIKRQAASKENGRYPTPIPTSSTGILSSSPPRINEGPSIGAKRTALGPVHMVELNENGETLLMGRSSNSSHFQLSDDRLVSRVHVKARYIRAMHDLDSHKVEVVCNGWNGMTLQCQGKSYSLSKGDSFTTATEGSEIIIDVQGCSRVRIVWPTARRDHDADDRSVSSWDDSPLALPAQPALSGLQVSPLRRTRQLETPVSPSPVNASNTGPSLEEALERDIGPRNDHDATPAIQIYEDSSADELPEPPQPAAGAANASMLTDVACSMSSDLSDLHSISSYEDDPDEENDPIVHSFGPFGANLSSRLAAISAASPKRDSAAVRLSPLPEANPAGSENASRPSSAAESPEMKAVDAPDVSNDGHTTNNSLPESLDMTAISNHVINQLAYSRLSSSPLSALMNNLPAQQKENLTLSQLESIVESIRCIGTIRRQGKDAAGKPLESQYYYIPEQDADEQRRVAVTENLRKPSLRSCRKQHKQYYWKRPKTP